MKASHDCAQVRRSPSVDSPRPQPRSLGHPAQPRVPDASSPCPRHSCPLLEWLSPGPPYIHATTPWTPQHGPLCQAYLLVSGLLPAVSPEGLGHSALPTAGVSRPLPMAQGGEGSYEERAKEAAASVQPALTPRSGQACAGEADPSRRATAVAEEGVWRSQVLGEEIGNLGPCASGPEVCLWAQRLGLVGGRMSLPFEFFSPVDYR